MKNLKKVEKSDYIRYVDFLRDNDLSHTITYTNRTYVVDSKELGREVFSSGDIRKKGMNLIRKVQSYVKDSNAYDKYKGIDFKSKGLRRFYYNFNCNGTYHDVVEVDLNNAYWYSAYKLKVISGSIFSQGLKGKKRGDFSKIELLASLGSLAKTKKKKTYDPEKMIYTTEVLTDSSETKHLWDAISFEVDKCMIECAELLGDDFYFYWTDAVFFRNTPENLQKVTECMERHSFFSKKVDVQYMEFRNEEQKVYVWTKYKKGAAKNDVLDEYGNKGRVFPFDCYTKKTLEEELNEYEAGNTEVSQ
jgi:hypothetical protein